MASECGSLSGGPPLLSGSASVVVMGAVMMYHITRRSQLGYHRFSLDFLPVWFMLLAPFAAGRRARWVAAASVAWSVLYFRCVIRWA